jgi:glucose/arabinose dehydrogenase
VKTRQKRWLRSLLVLFCLLAGSDMTRFESVPVVHGSNPLVLPPGFVDETIVSGLLSPRAFAFTPDGRILIAERGSETSADINFASIRVFKNGALLTARAITFNVCGDGERGFLGMALDPNFGTNGYLYVYYTRQATSGAACAYNTYSQGLSGPRNRISRVTMVGDTVDPASERVLVDNIATDSGIHNSGDLHFGADGYLYASVGNSNLESPLPPSTVPMSQDLTRLGGKILRILPTSSDPDGYVTTGNPFDTATNAWKCGPLANPPGSGTGPCKEIFAYGFRNPFRFTIQPGTSTPFVGDVGGGVWEEIDLVTAGGNYGWPVREGPCPAGILCILPQPPTPGMIDPVYAYSHAVINANFDSAVIGGDFYTGVITGTPYPAEYLNNYFFADFVRGFMRRLVYDSGSGTWSAITPDFATGADGIIGIRTGPDGNLYYLNFPTDQAAVSEIHRIRYAPGVNQPPVAQIGVNPQSGPLNTVYTFSAVGSYDPDNNLPLTYGWDLGDSATVSSTSALTVTHIYTTPGVKTVTLTVIDSGAPPLPSTPVTVTVFPGNSPPTGTIMLTNTTNLSRSNQYYAGDTWQFAVVNASDDQPLPPNPFLWDVAFHHRSHTHPFLSGIAGPGGQFTIPPIGETDPVVWYRMTLHITDAQGQTTTIDRDLYPVTTTLTLNTDPAGGQVILEGGVYTAPLTVTRVVSMNIGIDVPSPQVIAGGIYTFTRWSNGQSKEQTLVVPPTPTTLTAMFAPAYRIWLPLVMR